MRGVAGALAVLVLGLGTSHAVAATDGAVAQVLRLESFVLDDGRLKVELFVAPDVPSGLLELGLPVGGVPLGACGGGGRVCQGGQGRSRRARRRGVDGRRVTLVASLPNAPRQARAVSPGRAVLVTMQVGGRAGTTSTVLDCEERGRSFRCRAAPPPHVLLVIADALGVMPAVKRELVARGSSFPNAFVTTPVSDPSRGSMLTGLYARDDGATALAGADHSTIATWLAAAGYRTGHFGTYLSGYRRLGPPERPAQYVPPGWQRWLAFRVPGDVDYELVDERGQLVAHGSEVSTDVLAAAARDWIGRALDEERPVLVHFAPDDARREGSLRAVNEAVATMLLVLRTRDAERDALVVYTSDPGQALGERRLVVPGLCPYEECVRVPLVLRYPPLVPEGAQLPMLVENVDLAPTLAALAGVLRPNPVDGRDLVPLFAGAPPAWRDEVLLEDPDGFTGVRTARWKLVRYTASGEVELYDLEHDPNERATLSADPAQAERRAELERRAAALSASTPDR